MRTLEELEKISKNPERLTEKESFGLSLNAVHISIENILEAWEIMEGKIAELDRRVKKLEGFNNAR